MTTLLSTRPALDAPEEILGHKLHLEKHILARTARRYFITDLGTLGGTESFAYAINDSGHITGLSRTSGDASTHAFLYKNGAMTDLYPLNSQDVGTVGPTGINNAGQIASDAMSGGICLPAVLDSTTANITFLGSLGGVTDNAFNGAATAINDVGNAVGYSYLNKLLRHAFFYANGVMTDIGSFGGYSGAFAVNNDNIVVGFSSEEETGVAHAFVYANGVMTRIGPDTESYARGINNRGQVVGEFLAQGGFHAFLYSQGVFTDLGSPASPQTSAYAINNHGEIVGNTFVPVGSEYKQRAFILRDGNIVELNSLIPPGAGWDLSWAFDINNRGEIVGYGTVNQKFRAFLLTPASKDLLRHDGWKRFGFKNEGECTKFVEGK